MIKFAIIIDNISKGAGTERAVINMINGLLELKANEHEISIISLFSDKNQKPYFEIKESVKIIHLGLQNNPTLINKIPFYWNLYSQIKKLNYRFKWNFLIGTTYIHNIIIGSGNLFSKKIKLIACEHVTYHYPNKLIRLIRRVIYRFVDELVVLNEYEKDSFSFLRNVTIIPNVLLVPKQSESLSGNYNPTNKVISVGRLTFEKGIDTFIEVAELIHQKNNNVEFEIFGEGEELESLKQNVINKGLASKVTFKGGVDDLRMIYTGDSILLSTSRTESFGMSIIEAMAMNVPVISFDNSGPKNIITSGYDGVLISKGDEKAMAENCLDLISNENKRNVLINNASISIEKFTPEKVIPLWNRLFLKVCGR